MSILLETTEGNIVLDLFTNSQPILSYNFLKLCKLNHYFFAPLGHLQKDVLVQCETETGAINKHVDILKRFPGIVTKELLIVERTPQVYPPNTAVVLASFLTKEAENGSMEVNSLFSLSLTTEIAKLPENNLPFAKVGEGFAVLEKINLAEFKNGIFATDIRILHTHVLYDPYEDPPDLEKHRKSVVIPSDAQLEDIRIPELLGKKSLEKSSYQALALELIGDLPHYQIKPSPQTLFLARLNEITSSDSLETIFGRFGAVRGVNIVHDPKTGKSLCYGFVEFEDEILAERAYAKLSKGCFIDGKNVVVDFSQSVKNMQMNNERR